jgi:hypothetical protein
MSDELKIKMYALTLDCKDPYELAKFYAALLKWEIAFHEEEYVVVGPPGTNEGEYPCIAFQRNLEYNPPPCGRESLKLNNKWRISTSPSMI